MTTLKKARESGDFEQFIREREENAPGDMDKLEAALKCPSLGTVKSGQGASTPDSRDD